MAELPTAGERQCPPSLALVPTRAHQPGSLTYFHVSLFSRKNSHAYLERQDTDTNPTLAQIRVATWNVDGLAMHDKLRQLKLERIQQFIPCNSITSLLSPPQT